MEDLSSHSSQGGCYGEDSPSPTHPIQKKLLMGNVMGTLW